MSRSDNDIIYEAEAAWCIFPTMMTGWADSNKCSGGVELGRVTRRINYSINCLTDSAKSPLDRIQRFWTYYIGRVLSQYAEDVKGRIFTHSINRLAKDDLESRIPQL